MKKKNVDIYFKWFKKEMQYCCCVGASCATNFRTFVLIKQFLKKIEIFYRKMKAIKKKMLKCVKIVGYRK